jgi:hypothetical protein
MVIFIGYFCYYAGMITYDQYFKKDDVPLEATVEEEEIDISEEAKAFQPQNITKDKKKELSKEEQAEQEIMSGRIEIDDLLPKVDELAEKGMNSALGKLLADWNELPEAA